MSDIENSAVENDKDNSASSKPPAAGRSGTKDPKAGKREKQEKNTADKKQAYMYLGPNLPGGILFTGSVYRERPKHLSFAIKKAPEIQELFVEIKEVAAFKAELERQGSEPFRLRQAVERLISEGALNHVGL